MEYRARSIPLEVSIELPAGESDDHLLAVQEGNITGTIIRKRRQFPRWVTNSALAILLYSALLSSAVLAFTIYTFNKARQARAQNAANELFDRLQPILANITRAVGARRC